MLSLLKFPSLSEIHAQTNNNKWYNQVDRWGGGRRLLIFILGGRLWRVNRWTRTWRLTMRPHRPSPCISFSLSVCVCVHFFFCPKRKKFYFWTAAPEQSSLTPAVTQITTVGVVQVRPEKKVVEIAFGFRSDISSSLFIESVFTEYTHAQITATVVSFRLDKKWKEEETKQQAIGCYFLFWIFLCTHRLCVIYIFVSLNFRHFLPHSLLVGTCQKVREGRLNFERRDSSSIYPG